MFIICLQFVYMLFITGLYNVLKDKGKGYLNRVLMVNNMKQYVKLNNKTFEIKKTKSELHPITQVRSLDDCYKNPSIAKQLIYDDWLEWYMKEDNNFILKHFSVNSYNINMFTLRCDVYSMDNEFLGCIYISKTRQEFWTI